MIECVHCKGTGLIQLWTGISAQCSFCVGGVPVPDEPERPVPRTPEGDALRVAADYCEHKAKIPELARKLRVFASFADVEAYDTVLSATAEKPPRA
jgi:hypothetical protein